MKGSVKQSTIGSAALPLPGNAFMTALDPSITARLKQAAGHGGWSEDQTEIAPHLVELRGRWTGRTPLLLKPSSTQAVARILSVCNETGTPVVPQGGNTGLVGGQIPTRGEVLLSVERMTRIRSVSSEGDIMIAEAGVILKHAQQAADDAGRLFPLSLGAEGSCTIGGNVSTNAGGVNVLRYGMMRDLVLGLEVVLADGRVLDLMRGLKKDNTGYDLKQLFIGAEGTLGVVTAAMLKLFPKPTSYATAAVAISSVPAGLDLLHKLQHATGGLVTAFELLHRHSLELVVKHIPGTANPLPHHLGWILLVEVSNPAAFDATDAMQTALARAMDEGGVIDVAFAKTGRDRQALWLLRESIPDAHRLESATVSNDISVPPPRLAAFMTAADEAIRGVLLTARSYPFGHLGDGNLHYAIKAPGDDAALMAVRPTLERTVQDKAAAFGGSISAEHGLGLARNEDILRYRSAAEIEIMRALKRTLDPKHILNPGKLLA
jgi:FAD/FMN-containing dehydrogenase